MIFMWVNHPGGFEPLEVASTTQRRLAAYSCRPKDGSVSVCILRYVREPKLSNRREIGTDRTRRRGLYWGRGVHLWCIRNRSDGPLNYPTGARWEAIIYILGGRTASRPRSSRQMDYHLHQTSRSSKKRPTNVFGLVPS